MKAYICKAGIIQAKVGHEYFIYDVLNENFYSFNKTASFLMELIFSVADEKTIFEIMTRIYSKTFPELVSKSVYGLLDELLKEGLIKETSVNKRTELNYYKGLTAKFVKPSYKKYSKKYLVENNPEIVKQVCYVDRWNPAEE